MRFVVAGGAGFVVGHVCGRLLDARREVAGAEGFYDRAATRRTAARLWALPGFTLVPAGIHDLPAIRERVRPPGARAGSKLVECFRAER